MYESIKKKTYSFMKVIGNISNVGWKTKLMHHPISFGAFSSTSTIVHQRLLEANAFMGFLHAVYRLIYSCGFPKPWPCYPVWPHTVPVLPPSYAEKVPFFLPNWIHLFMHQFPQQNHHYQIINSIHIYVIFTLLFFLLSFDTTFHYYLLSLSSKNIKVNFC